MEFSTVQAWFGNNSDLCEAAEKSQRCADVAISDAISAGDQADERATRGTNFASRKFTERIQDLEFLQAELDKQKEVSVEELDVLIAYKKRVQEALDACSEPLKITKKCIDHRNARIGIELVDDSVFRLLKAEESTIILSQVQLRHILALAGEQARLLKATQFALDMDLRGKAAAIGIDRYCAHLNHNSSDITAALVLTNLKGRTSITEWDFHTRQNISASNHEVQKSRRLRSDINLLLRKVHEQITQHYLHTNNAFNKRIKETKDSKGKLENELSETTRQANVVRSTLTQLEEPMATITQHSALVLTRLNTRASRPGVEKCRDAVELHLEAELRELQNNAENLKLQQAKAESSLQCLRKNIEKLTEDLNKKMNTLMIDEVQCMTERLSMHYHLY